MPQLEPFYFLNSISWAYLIFMLNFILLSKIFLPLNIKILLVRLKLISD